MLESFCQRYGIPDSRDHERPNELFGIHELLEDATRNNSENHQIPYPHLSLAQLRSRHSSWPPLGRLPASPRYRSRKTFFSFTKQTLDPLQRMLGRFNDHIADIEKERVRHGATKHSMGWSQAEDRRANWQGNRVKRDALLSGLLGVARPLRPRWAGRETWVTYGDARQERWPPTQPGDPRR